MAAWALNFYRPNSYIARSNVASQNVLALVVVVLVRSKFLPVCLFSSSVHGCKGLTQPIKLTCNRVQLWNKSRENEGVVAMLARKLWIPTPAVEEDASEARPHGMCCRQSSSDAAGWTSLLLERLSSPRDDGFHLGRPWFPSRSAQRRADEVLPHTTQGQ